VRATLEKQKNQSTGVLFLALVIIVGCEVPMANENRGSALNDVYKRDHFVDSFAGEAAFLEGRIARPRRHSLAMATIFMVQRRQAFNS